MTKRIKIEKRGKSSYAYELTSTYDPTIKNTRSTKRYLGKVNGHDQAGNPKIERKWTKKSILQKILEESEAKSVHRSFLETLILNYPYQIPEPKGKYKSSKNIDKQKSYFYFYKYLNEINIYIELFVSSSNVRSNYILMDVYKNKDYFENRTSIVISDSKNSFDNLNRKSIIIIKNSDPCSNFPKVNILNNFVVTTKELELFLQNTNEILAVLIFNELTNLINKRKEINSSACESIIFTFNEIIQRCLSGKNNHRESFESVYLDLQRLISQ